MKASRHVYHARLVEMAAGMKQQLEADAGKAAGLRLPDDRFMVIQRAMGTPQSRVQPAAAARHAFFSPRNGSIVMDALLATASGGFRNLAERAARQLVWPDRCSATRRSRRPSRICGSGRAHTAMSLTEIAARQPRCRALSAPDASSGRAWSMRCSPEHRACGALW